MRQAILSADIVVLMNKGCVKLVGSPADLSSCSEYSAHTALSPLLVLNQVKSVESCLETESSSSQEKECIQIFEETEETIDLEERKEGKVELSVYRSEDLFNLLFVMCSLFSEETY